MLRCAGVYHLHIENVYFVEVDGQSEKGAVFFPFDHVARKSKENICEKRATILFGIYDMQLLYMPLSLKLQEKK